MIDLLLAVMQDDTPIEFIWGALTSETDNPYAIGANIVLSFIPVAGELLDLIALFVDPTVWGKAFALIGLVASLLSDGAQILTAVGIAVPPALAALPAAVGAEAVDVGAALLRNVRKLVSAEVFQIIKKIGFDEALDLGGDLLGHLAQRAVKQVGGAGQWPDEIGEVVSLIQGILHLVWEPFVALLTHYRDNLAGLFKLGFGDGGLLAGRVLHSGGSYSDVNKVVEGIAEIGDEVGEAAAELSNDAVKALGDVVDDAGASKTRQLLEAMVCPVGVTQKIALKPAGLAYPLVKTDVDKCIEALAEIAPGNARDGFDRLVNQDPKEAANLWNLYENHPDRDVLFAILNKSQIDPRNFVQHLEFAGGVEKAAKLEMFWNLVPTGEFRRLDALLLLADGDGVKFDYLADIVLNLERRPIPSSLPKPSDLHGFSGADMDHFLDGHTYEYLRPDLRLNRPTTLWPKGTTPEQVRDYLQEALDDLAAKGKLPIPGTPKTTWVSGIEVQVGVRSDGVGGTEIGQFFPLRTNTGYVTIISQEMKAIWDIFRP